MVKKAMMVLLSLVMIISGMTVSSVSLNQVPVTISVDGENIEIDSPSYLCCGVVYSPLREFTEALGADDLLWDVETNTATIIYRNKEYALTANDDHAVVNGGDEYIDVNGVLIFVDDVACVPIGFLAKTLDALAVWNEDTGAVDVTKDTTAPFKDFDPPNSDSLNAYAYTNDDLYWLSRIINAESCGEPMEGKIAVGNVVMNRVKNPKYPSTVYGVIFDGNQFSPAHDGSIYRTPTSASVEAALRVLSGENNIGNCLFFCNPRTSTSQWAMNNRKMYAVIGNHAFFE